MQTGDRVDRYVVEHLLGVGGAAEVHAVRHSILGTRHALKVLRKHSTALSESVVREGCLQARLDPERVISVTDVLMVEGQPALLMPLVDGCTLREVLDHGPIPESEAIAVFRAVAEAVKLAHADGIVHCDLKPSNVLLDRHRGRIRVRVADFGIALVASQASTEPRRVSGTPAYGSPEQFDRHATLDGRTDIWSLGVILYELLTGNRPFASIDTQSTLRAVRAMVVDFEPLPEAWRPVLAAVFVPASSRPRDTDYWLEQPLLAGAMELSLESRVAEIVREPGSARGDIPPRRGPGAGPATETATPSNNTTDSLLEFGLGEATDTIFEPVGISRGYPWAQNAFIGRRSERQRLTSLLMDHEQLIVVTGPPGVGKSRLVHECVQERREEWSGGAWYCNLTDARTGEDIHRLLLHALDLQCSEVPDAEGIGRSLSSRGRCCLVFDQADAVLGPLLQVLPIWLVAAPEVRFVVTTRLAASLDGSVVVSVPPMPAEDSRALYLERADDPTARDSPALDALVALLDGLPLAIELAASWSGELSPEDMVRRIEDRCSILRANGPTWNGGELALEATLDWSWALLTPWEQSTLAQLSVFEGGFCSDALDEILDLTEFPTAPWPIHCVQSLVEHSLVQSSGDDRFSLLSTIQHYAGNALTRSGGRSETEARHGRWFAQVGSAANIEAIHHHGQAGRLQLLRLEEPNLAIACHRAIRRGDSPTALATMAALLAGLEDHGPMEDGVRWLERVEHELSLTPSERALHDYWRLRVSVGQRFGAGQCEAFPAIRTALEACGHRNLALDLEVRSLYERYRGAPAEVWGPQVSALEARCTAGGSTPLRARLAAHHGRLLARYGETERSIVAYQHAARLAERCGDRRLQGKCLHNLALAHGVRGELPRQASLLRKALAIARETGNRISEGNSLSSLGMVHNQQGQMRQALAYLEDAVTCAVETGNRRTEPNIRLLHADALLEVGRTAEAWRQLEQTRALADAARDHLIRGFVSIRHAELHTEQDRLVDAEKSATMALEILCQLHDGWSVEVARICLGDIYHRMGDRPRARVHLQQAVEGLRSVHHPAEGTALGHLALVEQEDGHGDEAVRLLTEAERILARFRGSPVADTLAIQKARILGAQKQFDEAGRILASLAGEAQRKRAGPEWRSSQRRHAAEDWLQKCRTSEALGSASS